jgi:hypothetical protein
LGRLRFEKLRFFLNGSQTAGNAISETKILNIPLGACPQIPIANLCMWYSAHTFGDLMLSWGEGKGTGLFGSFAPPLKNP